MPSQHLMWRRVRTTVLWVLIVEGALWFVSVVWSETKLEWAPYVQAIPIVVGFGALALATRGKAARLATFVAALACLASAAMILTIGGGN